MKRQMIDAERKQSECPAAPILGEIAALFERLAIDYLNHVPFHSPSPVEPDIITNNDDDISSRPRFLGHLTVGEKSVLRLFQERAPPNNHEITSELHLSETAIKTIREHLSHLINKVGVKNLGELMQLDFSAQLSESDTPSPAPVLKKPHPIKKYAWDRT